MSDHAPQDNITPPSPLADFASRGAMSMAPAGGVKDSALLARLRGYKRKVTQRYRVVRPDQIHDALLPEPHWVTPKIDGELWFAVKRGAQLALVSPDGRALMALPALDELTKALEDLSDVLIAGELHVIDEGELRPVSHALRRVLETGLEVDKLRFAAFDLIQEGDRDWQAEPWEERLGWLGEHIGSGRLSAAIPAARAASPADVEDHYDTWVKTGRAEGLIVRDPYGLTYKLKPQVTLDAVVIAFDDEHDGASVRMASMTLALQRPDGAWQLLGQVSQGFSHSDRVHWHQTLMPQVVPSEHMQASAQGTLCRFVRPQHVVEVVCDDLRTDMSRFGGQVQKPVLHFDPERGYLRAGRMPLAHPVALSFQRARPDKAPDDQDASAAQVYAHAPFDGLQDTPRASPLPAAAVIRREVYTKTVGDVVSVRKVVALAHDHAQTPDSPAFVAHFTDFSPERTAPLKTSLRVAGDLDHLEAIIEAWIEANIKRGWSLSK